MAVLYIAELSSLAVAVSPGGWPSQPLNTTTLPGMPPITEQTLAIGASVASAPFNALTRFVRLACDSVCSIAWSSAANPTPNATTSNMRLAANQTEYFGVSPGMKLAVIANT
jgi:hypothetical protein